MARARHRRAPRATAAQTPRGAQAAGVAWPARDGLARGGLARGGLAVLVLAAGWVVAPCRAGARPDEAGWVESRQLVELFSDSCLRFAAPDALRAWLAGQGYRRMPALQEQALLRSPGRGYDASTRTGHQALLSRDDGWCIAVADHADPARLVGLLEARLHLAGVDFRPVGDEPPPGRRYSLQQGNRRSLLIVMVTPLDDRLQASLLLAPMD